MAELLSLGDRVEDLKDEIESQFRERGETMPRLMCSIQRRNKGKVGAAVLQPMPLDELVEKEYEYAAKVGGGEYTVSVRAEGSGRTIRALPWDVDGVPIAQVPPPPEIPTPQLAGGGSLDPTAMLMSMMQAGSSQTAAMIQAQSQQSNAMMQAMMGLISTLMARPGPERTPLDELKDLLDLVGERRGEDDSWSGVLSAIPELLAQMGRPPTPPRAAPPRPAPAPPVQTESTRPAVIGREQLLAEFIKRVRPELAEHADVAGYVLGTAARLVETARRTGQDAEAAADMVETLIDGEVIDELVKVGEADLASLIRIGSPETPDDYAREVARVLIGDDDDDERTRPGDPGEPVKEADDAPGGDGADPGGEQGGGDGPA